MSYSTHAEIAQTIEPLVRPLLERYPALCLTVGVTVQGKRLLLSYGETTLAVTPGERIYPACSITKTFTTTALASLVQEGRLRLEDRVLGYLPEPVRHGMDSEFAVTFEQLATHTSGLPSVPDNLVLKKRQPLRNPYADYSAQAFQEFLHAYRSSTPLPAAFEYSNVGMALLGTAVAQREGVSYEQLIRQRVAEPLGMGDTRITLGADRLSRLVQGHTWLGRPAPYWTLPVLEGAGAFFTTADDMLTYWDFSLGNAVGQASGSGSDWV